MKKTAMLSPEEIVMEGYAVIQELFALHQAVDR
jgi:hypothetical protein